MLSGTGKLGAVDAAPSTGEALVLEPGKPLTIDALNDVAFRGRRVVLGTSAFNKMRACNNLLRRKILRGETIYGVTTAFGGNSSFQIPADNASLLQTNLLTFLQAGTGHYLPTPIVRAGLLLRAKALSLGWSAARPEVVEQILNLLNAGITPRVPEYGSVGASGDLVPSAHSAVALLGHGDVLFRDQVMRADKALQLAGLKPIELEAKEGLALVNGTTTMTGFAAVTIDDVAFTYRVGLAAIAIAVEALRSSADYFDPRIQMVKGHPGQIAVANILRRMLSGSRLCIGLHSIRERVADTGRLASETHSVARAKEAVQAPYSLRCVPQGLGPIFESIRDARIVIEREMNSVNDNPLLDPASGDVLHGGNFFGSHIARAMDGLKLDICNLANWTHSILGSLMDERFSQGLPNSLSPRLGVFQGLKGLQLSHTSLVAHLRRDSAPSSVHTLPTEQFNQDVVSLGTHAAATTYDMSRMLRDAVAMTLIAVTQAIDIRSGAGKLGIGTAPIHSAVRSVSPFVEEDRALFGDIAAVSNLIAERRIPVLDFD
jgi:phenylalanine ammonia-lyase